MKHTIIPSSYLIFRKEGKILLLCRQNTGFEDGNYGLVAGHGEKGESFTHAALRECKEEAGVDLDPSNLELAHIMHRKASNDERVDAFFFVNAWRGEVVNKEPEKCSDLSWFDEHNLPENTIEYVRIAIENSLKGLAYSEYNWDESVTNDEN